MQYLITGGAGFIGSHLAEKLIAQNHKVLILDDLSTGSYENIAHIDDGKNLRLIVESITNVKIVNECVKEADAVFHLAAAVGVKLIIDQPVRTIKTIAIGTDILLDHCARYRKPVLITSTSEVYGKGNNVPFSEDDDRVIGPATKRRWSYAVAKSLDEFLLLAHWYESRLPVVIVRLFNTVGPRQTGQYGMVIPRFIRQGLQGLPITVYGDGRQTRCFCHVKDIVEALVLIMERKEARGQIYNLGNDEEISIADLALRVREMTGGRSEIVFIPYREAYGEDFDDMQRRVPDLSKIKTLIGYRAKKNLSTILQDMIAFEQEHADKLPGNR